MNYTIKPLYLGKFAAHEKSVFTYRTDYGVKVEAPTLCFLVEGGGQQIIFDAGPENPELADKSTEQSKKVNAFCDARYMQDVLLEHGIKAEEITTLVLSHLHWDHCSNVGLFKNAKIFVQHSELAYAVDPLPWDRKSPYNIRPGNPGNELPLWFEGFLNMEVIDGDYTLASGLQIVTLPGHSPGVQGLLVDTEEGKYLISSDHFPLYENFEKGIPSGIHTSLFDWYDSYKKAKRICDFVLPGHDIKVLERSVYGKKDR